MILNFLLFQLGWFASVLSAARQTPWLGVLTVSICVIVHFATKGSRGEVVLVVTSALMGALADTLLLDTGLVVYASQTPFEWLAPAWIVAMWANFAITLRHCLAWLSGRWALATILGAVAGPMAYWGAARLGAVEVVHPVSASFVLAMVWGAAVPALLRISQTRLLTESDSGRDP